MGRKSALVEIFGADGYALRVVEHPDSETYHVEIKSGKITFDLAWDFPRDLLHTVEIACEHPEAIASLEEWSAALDPDRRVQERKLDEYGWCQIPADELLDDSLTMLKRLKLRLFDHPERLKQALESIDGKRQAQTDYYAKGWSL